MPSLPPIVSTIMIKGFATRARVLKPVPDVHYPMMTRTIITGASQSFDNDAHWKQIKKISNMPPIGKQLDAEQWRDQIATRVQINSSGPVDEEQLGFEAAHNMKIEVEEDPELEPDFWQDPIAASGQIANPGQEEEFGVEGSHNIFLV